VGEAIDFLREAPSLPDQFYHVILSIRVETGWLCDAGQGVVGQARDVAEAIFSRTVSARFRPRPDEGDVAYIFNQYHLISCPCG
jgi:magnesium transporter